MIENESLRKQLDALQYVVKAKDDTLAAKDALIATLQGCQGLRMEQNKQ